MDFSWVSKNVSSLNPNLAFTLCYVLQVKSSFSRFCQIEVSDMDLIKMGCRSSCVKMRFRSSEVK